MRRGPASLLRPRSTPPEATAVTLFSIKTPKLLKRVTYLLPPIRVFYHMDPVWFLQTKLACDVLCIFIEVEFDEAADRWRCRKAAYEYHILSKRLLCDLLEAMEDLPQLGLHLLLP